jgi:hypothetical protein
MPEQVAAVLEHRRQRQGDELIDLGAICGFLYVGTPTWDVGRGVLSGSAEAIAAKIRDFGAMGVNHVQVRFKARSLGEQLEQMDRFGADVAPLLND